MSCEYVEITKVEENILSSPYCTEYILLEPVGLPGKDGASSTTLLTVISDKPLGSNRVITNTLNYADNTNLSHIGNILGISLNAVNTGQELNLMFSGELDGFSSLTLSPVYLSTNGTITQTPPTTGFILRIGTAISSTKILISLSTPILQV